MRSWFLKKKLMGAGLILKLLQTPCYCTDCLFKYNAINGIPRGEENMSPGLEAEARDLAESELAWTNKSGANRVKEF